VPGTGFVVLSIVIGVTRAAAIVLAVLAAVFPAISVTILAPAFATVSLGVFATILAAIFTARRFIGLASDGRRGEQGARDEQCSTQL